MCPRPGTILNITATMSLALPSAVCVAPRIQSQRSQRSASLGRRCPQYGHGIWSPVVGSGLAAGASVYSTFILNENHKRQRFRQANRQSNLPVFPLERRAEDCPPHLVGRVTPCVPFYAAYVVGSVTPCAPFYAAPIHGFVTTAG